VSLFSLEFISHFYYLGKNLFYKTKIVQDQDEDRNWPGSHRTTISDHNTGVLECTEPENVAYNTRHGSIGRIIEGRRKVCIRWWSSHRSLSCRLRL